VQRDECAALEIKRQDAPRVTKSMRVAQQDLRLDQIWVLYPGTLRYVLADGIECVPLTQVRDLAT